MNFLGGLMIYLLLTLISGIVFEEMNEHGIPMPRNLMWLWPVFVILLLACLAVSAIETTFRGVENLAAHMHVNTVRRQRAFTAYHEACRRAAEREENGD